MQWRPELMSVKKTGFKSIQKLIELRPNKDELIIKIAEIPTGPPPKK